ncbi:2-polyprenyl-6-methoxyphenol hydroxylase-like FAD-dependent oxidoreductase [Actinoplanes octamycinicus]|uniref:2-polyprenyl-6-methoxyphenol hydroxylase-like FAD-dependent oxidoreductase n=1 Tax=Actinoplanes octamycinicus TaxID=135948 RepID=A0A7W7M849_9ACTN|nr:FAD-dependent monooxygenase [Actinoplanes octamycinicus]MBB4740552.1 2-polyprenyl-6-methoxyphenol hydroxylase-like FAD-dependent oxidoreductase [Actinoplanes octamycinicus]GIE59810.1 FAD-dependent oxidoreductase [Actinoplanes octamycinicus]
MPAVRNVLVVGGGAAGAAAAILLAEGGVAVDLIDLKPDVAALGSGITLQGNALRVLRRLGVWDRIRTEGYPFDTLGLRAPDPAGTLIAELTDIRTGGPDLPATLGMYRPTFAGILIKRAAEVGVAVRFGTQPSALAQDGDAVTVTFEHGRTRRYDLVIGADGLRSWTRRAIGIDGEPQPVGMGIWRTFTRRPASITRTDLFYGGPAYLAGYCPTGPDSIYAYLVEQAQDRFSLTPDEALTTMRELSRAYHGPWDEIREQLTDPSRVNYTAFESHVLDGPWHRDRVVVIGDAAHSCPPTLAQGAAQALEDASVLAELLLRDNAVTDDLWTEFTARRLPRATEVVEASLQLCRWLLAHERGDVPGLMARISHLVAEPA